MVNIFINIRKSTVIILLVAIIVFLLVRCMGNHQPGTDSETETPFQRFAGTASCARCHQDIYQKHLLTEHHLTSAQAGRNNILGSFDPGKNTFAFNAVNYVAMEKRDSGLYQVEYVGAREMRKGRFDIVVGSGRKGQSYLAWISNRLVQLPITYFTSAGQWSNSPGYSPNRPSFYRPITSRCLECHSTYFEKTSDPARPIEDFNRDHIVYAVDCEKCHGPSAEHVAYHTKNPSVKEAKYVLNPGKFSRERQLDLCALCHGGQLTKTRPSFSFQSGDTLANYFTFTPPDPNVNNIDVHGNQLGLLASSKCFTIGKVTCINCHNTHENEKGKLELFSQRCMNCHSDGHGPTCKMTATIGPSIKQDCIDCHMPKQPSHAIAVYLQYQSDPTPALLRTHLITNYPDETKKVLAYLKQQKTESKKSENKR